MSAPVLSRTRAARFAQPCFAIWGVSRKGKRADDLPGPGPTPIEAAASKRCSLRLAVQDVALSRRKQGFESPRERQCSQRVTWPRRRDTARVRNKYGKHVAGRAWMRSALALASAKSCGLACRRSFSDLGRSFTRPPPPTILRPFDRLSRSLRPRLRLRPCELGARQLLIPCTAHRVAPT